jgi:hypothetical protein
MASASEDLPDPFAPVIAKARPARTAAVTPRTAADAAPGWRTTTAFAVIAASSSPWRIA